MTRKGTRKKRESQQNERTNNKPRRGRSLRSLFPPSLPIQEPKTHFREDNQRIPLLHVGFPSRFSLLERSRTRQVRIRCVEESVDGDLLGGVEVGSYDSSFGEEVDEGGELGLEGFGSEVRKVFDGEGT